MILTFMLFATLAKPVKGVAHLRQVAKVKEMHWQVTRAYDGMYCAEAWHTGIIFEHDELSVECDRSKELAAETLARELEAIPGPDNFEVVAEE